MASWAPWCASSPMAAASGPSPLKSPSRTKAYSRNASRIPQQQQASEDRVQAAKMNLLRTALDTNRGFGTSSEQRALLEEAAVEVEKHDAGRALDLAQLDGTWLLRYTSAPDVVSILQADSLPFFKAGQIYQKFECKQGSVEGTVFNVVQWSIPGILQDGDGATLIVTAGFSVVSPRTIQLEFKEARLNNVALSEGFEALLAPALLPRTFINLQVLQFFKSLNLAVPLTGSPAGGRRLLGLLYSLTYLDDDMLIGRALGSGGLFLFGRTQSL